jgi:hypothetical protein
MPRAGFAPGLMRFKKIPNKIIANEPMDITLKTSE